MGRAAGKHGPRAPVIEPDTPAGDYIGESDRQKPGDRPYSSPIPGGAPGHIGNQPVVRQKVAVPDAKPDIRGMLAHGVPPAGHQTTKDHAEHMRGPNEASQSIPRPRYEHQDDRKIHPVAVYQVSRGLMSQAGDKFSVPANGTECVRIAGRDRDRTHIGLLIESASGGTLVTSPGVPATTVAKQNPNAFPVQVVIGANGATITAVVVNGVTVGTAAGTYYVPAFGAISISYTVATPTWTWSDPNGAGATGVRVDHEVGNLDVGYGNLVKPTASNYLVIGSADELFAVGADTYSYVLSVLYLYGIPGSV